MRASQLMYETHVFISEKDLPTAQRWVEAIAQSAYDLSMPQRFEMPGDVAHFIPCDIENLKSGFDLKIEPADFDEYNLNPQQLAQVGERNLVASFRTYSNAQEVAGMVVASGLLAEHFDGVIVSELEEELVLPGHNIAYVDEHLKSCREQFDGACDMRDPYDPNDPAANTVPEGSALLGFALLAIIGIFMLVVGVLGRVKDLFVKPNRKPVRWRLGHSLQAGHLSRFHRDQEGHFPIPGIRSATSSKSTPPDSPSKFSSMPSCAAAVTPTTPNNENCQPVLLGALANKLVAPR